MNKSVVRFLLACPYMKSCIATTLLFGQHEDHLVCESFVHQSTQGKCGGNFTDYSKLAPCETLPDLVCYRKVGP